MYSKEQVIAALTILDVGIMLAMMYVVGEMAGQTKMIVGVAVVAASIIVGYRMTVRG
jgi:hypothetical protein